jgi:hypothetical protein
VIPALSCSFPQDYTHERSFFKIFLGTLPTASQMNFTRLFWHFLLFPHRFWSFPHFIIPAKQNKAPFALQCAYNKAPWWFLKNGLFLIFREGFSDIPIQTHFSKKKNVWKRGNSYDFMRALYGKKQ